MRNTFVTLCACIVVLSGGAAYAQEQGQIGVAMGYPTSVGVLWHVSDRVAIRPAISFSHGWSETTIESGDILRTVPSPSFPGFVDVTPITRSTASSSTWTTGVDVSVLLYLGKWDNVRAYLAPGYGYRRSSSTSETSVEILTPLPPGLPPDFFGPRDFTSRSKSDSHAGSAAFGVQYTPHRRFSVFGELGVRYSESGVPVSIITSTLLGPSDDVRRGKSRSVGTATAVGVIFYFK
jgi:hypothetical protein